MAFFNGAPEIRFKIIFDVLHQPGNIQTVKELCILAGVSRSGYYRWIHAKDARIAKEKQDQNDFTKIVEAYKFRGYDKGIRGIQMRLLHIKEPVIMNHKKIARLMKKYGLKCPIRRENPYRKMMRSIKTNTIADNLLQRGFTKFGPRMALLTDITYIPCLGGFVYLSVIKDAYTREVLAYVLNESLKIDFVIDTINQLMQMHGDTIRPNALIHSDQGSHYTSYAFIEATKNANLRRSMSRRGNCWDNAPQESFFGHMKDHIAERVKKATTFQEVQAIIDDWMDYYNNDRYQWDLAKLSPRQYYEYVTTGKYPLLSIVNKLPDT